MQEQEQEFTKISFGFQSLCVVSAVCLCSLKVNKLKQVVLTKFKTHNELENGSASL